MQVQASCLLICAIFGLGASCSCSNRESVAGPGATSVGPASSGGQPSSTRGLRSAAATEAAERVLVGPAAPIATFQSDYEPLLDLASSTDRKTTCESVADRLAADLKPDDVVAAAASVEDPTLVEIALDLRVLVTDVTSACVNDDRAATDAALSKLTTAHVMFNRRLEEL